MKKDLVFLFFFGVAFAQDSNLTPLTDALTSADAEVRRSVFPAVSALIAGFILIALAFVVGRLLSRGD